MSGSNAQLAILLPAFVPDLHYLATWLRPDSVILDDTHTWSRKTRVHRSKVRSPMGIDWINIPVLASERKKSIREIRIDQNQPWIDHHLKTLFFNYRNSIYYDFYEPEIKADYKKLASTVWLMDACLYMQSRIWRYLELDFNYRLLSSVNDFKIEDWQGIWMEPNSKNYQQTISGMIEMPFKHPVYRQHFGGFEPGCCLLDLLFEKGPEAYEVIDMLIEMNQNSVID